MLSESSVGIIGSDSSCLKLQVNNIALVCYETKEDLSHEKSATTNY